MSRKAIINPEWLALEGKPYGELLLNPDSYKCINIGPEPKTPEGTCDGDGQEEDDD